MLDTIYWRLSTHPTSTNLSQACDLQHLYGRHLGLERLQGLQAQVAALGGAGRRPGGTGCLHLPHHGFVHVRAPQVLVPVGPPAQQSYHHTLQHVQDINLFCIIGAQWCCAASRILPCRVCDAGHQVSLHLRVSPRPALQAALCRGAHGFLQDPDDYFAAAEARRNPHAQGAARQSPIQRATGTLTALPIKP